MTTDVPADIPVTTPVPELTVATPVVALDQVPPDPVVLNVIVDPTHIMFVPEITPASPGAVTVIVRVAVTVGQPPVPTTV